MDQLRGMAQLDATDADRVQRLSVQHPKATNTSAWFSSLSSAIRVVEGEAKVFVVGPLFVFGLGELSKNHQVFCRR